MTGKTQWHHSHNADGTTRAKHCCGCWDIDYERLVAICNECGEEGDMAAAAALVMPRGEAP